MRTLPLLLLLLTACPQGPSPVPVDNDMCQPAEDNLLKLGCKDSRGELLGGPNKSGVPFHECCVNTQNAGVGLKPTCLAKITDCKEVDSCLQN